MYSDMLCVWGKSEWHRVASSCNYLVCEIIYTNNCKSSHSTYFLVQMLIPILLVTVVASVEPEIIHLGVTVEETCDVEHHDFLLSTW